MFVFPPPTVQKSAPLNYPNLSPEYKMLPRPSLCAAFALICSCTLPGAAHAANILTNSGFETGNLGGWRGYQSPDPVFTNVSNASAAHSGAYFADTAPLPAPFTQSIVQDFAAVDTGTIVEMSFWYRQPNPGGPSPAAWAYFELGPSHSSVFAPITVIGDGQWHQVVFGSPGVNATYVAFGALAQNTSGAPGTTGLQFDDFFFRNTPVPEPASATLAATALLLGLRRRR